MRSLSACVELQTTVAISGSASIRTFLALRLLFGLLHAAFLALLTTAFDDCVLSRYKRGDRPPAPRQSFQSQWDRYLQPEWSRVLLMFSAGTQCQPYIMQGITFC